MTAVFRYLTDQRVWPLISMKPHHNWKLWVMELCPKVISWNFFTDQHLSQEEVFKIFFLKQEFEKPLTEVAKACFSSVQSLSRVWLFVTPWTTPCQAFLTITNSQSLPKLMSIESVMPSNHLILCRPLPLLPSIFPSIRVFSNESAVCIRWPKYWSFSFSISPSSEHPWLISFRMDWLDILAVQGTLKSLLQHHSSKASNLWCSAFFKACLRFSNRL